MKRTGVSIIIVFFLILSVCSSVQTRSADETSQDLKFMAEYDGGELYRAGRISVVELSGNYRQMGRQYGMLLKDELTTLYHDAIEEFFIKQKGFTRERLQIIAQSFFDLYPHRYKEIIYGMAETSGLGIERQILLNGIEWFPKINHLLFNRCSGIAAWGPYTSGGPLVFGRNNDDDPFYKEFARFMVIAVFKPDDLSVPVALINYAGVIYNATGMNSEGLFIELNSGPWMGFSLDRLSIFVTLFSFLQDYPSLPEVDKGFKSTLANLSSIINVADRNRAYSYECSIYDTRRIVAEQEGLLAATNHFVGPTWNIAQIDEKVTTDTSIKRRQNLLALGEIYKGSFSPYVMMRVLDTPIDQGGATVEGTIYQVIAVPAQLKLWVKVPGLQDWTMIRLGPLFKKHRTRAFGHETLQPDVEDGFF
jgi:hypothetical protein